MAETALSGWLDLSEVHRAESSTNKPTPHPWDLIQELLPPLSDEEEANLRQSIRDLGIQEPVKILPDGRIIDGYHRWKLSDRKAPFRILRMNEEQGLALGLKLNLHRRHLSAEQLKELVVELRRRRFSQKQVAKLTGYSQQLISQVEKLEGIESDTRTGITFDLRVQIPQIEYAKIWERTKKEPLNRIAADYKVTPQRIRQIASKHEKVKSREAKLEELKQLARKLPPQRAKFSTIVVDPPWPYEDRYDPDYRRGALPYPSMSLDRIKRLKIPYAGDCVLWLWTTNGFLHEAFHTLSSWGFKSRSVLTWVKHNFGVGDWLRGQTEHCILATRGHPKTPESPPPTVLYAKAREHSRKPDEFYSLVSRICEDPKLDYFGREKREGWVIYGTSQVEQ